MLVLPLAGLAQTAAVAPGALERPPPQVPGTASVPAAQPAPDGAAVPALKASTELGPLPGKEAARALPIILRARSFSGQLDQQAVAKGEVEFRRAGVVIRADELTYDSPTDTAQATGHVRISRDGAVYSGPALSVAVQRFEGSFSEPTFDFLALGVGGRAQRVDFLGPQRRWPSKPAIPAVRPPTRRAGRKSGLGTAHAQGHVRHCSQ